MIGMDLGIRCDFVRENTRQQRPAIVPELVLYLAGGAAPIWGLTKEELDTLGLPPPYWSYGWAGGQGLARYMLDHPHEVAGMNAALNGVTIAFTDANLLQLGPPNADVILAGDVWYRGPLAEQLMAWLAAARAAGTRVLLGDPGRTFFPTAGVVRLADNAVPTIGELEGAEVMRATVWELD